MKPYTDEDLRRLVFRVRNVMELIDKGTEIHHNSPHAKRLRETLKPFLPDPEEEAIEAMAKAAWERDGSKWAGVTPESKEIYRKDFRAALAVLKEKGWSCNG